METSTSQKAYLLRGSTASLLRPDPSALVAAGYTYESTH